MKTFNDLKIGDTVWISNVYNGTIYPSLKKAKIKQISTIENRHVVDVLDIINNGKKLPKGVKLEQIAGTYYYPTKLVKIQYEGCGTSFVDEEDCDKSFTCEMTGSNTKYIKSSHFFISTERQPAVDFILSKIDEQINRLHKFKNEVINM